MRGNQDTLCGRDPLRIASAYQLGRGLARDILGNAARRSRSQESRECAPSAGPGREQIFSQLLPRLSGILRSVDYGGRADIVWRLGEGCRERRSFSRVVRTRSRCTSQALKVWHDHFSSARILTRWLARRTCSNLRVVSGQCSVRSCLRFLSARQSDSRHRGCCPLCSRY